MSDEGSRRKWYVIAIAEIWKTNHCLEENIT